MTNYDWVPDQDHGGAALEGARRGGRMEALTVTPPERAKDVTVQLSNLD